MASKRISEPVDVTWSDQRTICTFGRMNKRAQDLAVEIKKRDEDIEKLNDAGDEIYIADEIKYVFGEAFIAMDCDGADTLLSAKKDLLQGELDALSAEKAELDSAMGKMKATLYAKFGDNIYLENE